MTVERTAAEWAASFRLDTAPAAIRDRVDLIYLDAVASAAAGAGQPLVRDVAPVAAALGELAGTSFGIAYAVTSATVCDVYRPGLCHVTPVTLPPVLALSTHATEREALLSALTVGLELTTRLCVALNYPRLRARGWHAPGVAGTVGAAGAAARLLGLGADGLASAFGHGAAQASGTFAALGTEAVKFNQARGAVSALLAALMAQAGLAASPDWLTHPDGGMARAYTDDADPAALASGLGDRWELERISLRRWPAASSVQSLIEACLEPELRGKEVRSLRVELAPAAFEVSGDRPWRTPLEAQQSARWVAAAVIVDGDWWLEHSDPARLDDPEIDALARRIDVFPNGELAAAAVRVEATLANGSTARIARDDAPGDPERPLTRLQVEEKLRRAAASNGLDADRLLASGPVELAQTFARAMVAS